MKKRIAAALVSAAMIVGTLSVMPMPETVLYADAAFVSDSFEISYDGWTNLGDATMLSAQDSIGYAGSRGMQVTDRLSSEDGAFSEKGLYLDGGEAYNYSIAVRNDGDQTETFRLNLTWVYPDGEKHDSADIAVKEIAPGEWATLSGNYTAPKDTFNLTMKLTNDGTSDFTFDEFNVTGQKKMNANTASAATSCLKDIYANYFRVGTVLNSGTVRNSSMTAIALREFNSLTFENELKPDATMNKSQSSGNNIGVSLNSAAGLLDFCSKNNIGVRGHTFVWHSQTPQWVFKEGLSDGGAWVSKDAMNQRMESYIKNMFAAIKTQYPNLNLYAYDVANECVSDDSNRTKNNGGAREPGYGNGKSPWVQVYGNNDFLINAFTYAKKYAPQGCSLFYNDYNEYWDHKRDCIAATCSNLFQKGILDGIGMQSHINADANGFSGTSAYVTAMKKYAAIGCQVQVTELDISTENSKFSLATQASKYKDVFNAAMEINKGSAGKVTAICIWGLNDANTWIGSENAPLLFDGNNQAKPAYNTLKTLVPESYWGDGDNPKGGGSVVIEPIKPGADGYYFHCTYESGVENWVERGGTTLAFSSLASYAGEKSLAISGRTDCWNGANYALSSNPFKPGEAFSFSAMAMQNSGAAQDMMLSLQYEDASGETQYAHLDTQTAASGMWVHLANTEYTIPSGASNVQLYVETAEGTCDFYVDEVIGAVPGTVVSAPTKGSGQRGDVNNDGAINGLDVAAAKKGILKGFTDNAEKKRADIDGENEVDVKDVQYLIDFVLRKIDSFPEIVSKIDTAKMEALFANVKATAGYKVDGENNPLYTQRFGADPGFLVYKDRLYVYTTNDDFEYDSAGKIKENSYDVQEINCISSADLVNWTDHGPIPVAGQSGAAKWAFCSWAPDACVKTINGKDKFFLYFANSGGGIGVLTADSPEGPWRDPIGKALVTGSSPNCNGIPWMFDPAVLVDDDGTGYLYFGGGVDGKDASNPGTARAVKLGDDMTSLAGTPVTMNPPYLFEDSSILKIGSTYYYSYCTNFSVPGGNPYGMNSGEIGYMTSSSPLGPFTYQGIMFKSTGSYQLDGGGNNHHSLVQFKGSYYLLYHARTIERRMGVQKNYRSPHIDNATVQNGKVSVTGTLKGVTQLEALNPYQTVQAETIYRQAGMTTNGLGDTNMSNKSTGDWFGVKGVAFTNGASSVTMRVKSSAGGAIKITTGSENGKAVGYVEVPATNGSYVDITAPVEGLSGTQNVYFILSGNMSVDSWSFK